MNRPAIKAAPAVSSPLTTVRHKRTLQRRILTSFLGSKNFKGLYSKNPLAFTPNYFKYDKTKNYISAYPVRASHMYEKVKVRWDNVFNGNRMGRQADSLQPFPENEFCKSALIIPTNMRNRIVDEHEAGETVQKLSFKYGLSLPRVESLIRLAQIEKNMARDNKITKEMHKLDNTMRAMFHTLKGDSNQVPFNAPDDLTEIPRPKVTNEQRFLTIAESEPFGPIDAAEVLGIEPASETLDKLTQHTETDNASSNSKSGSKSSIAFYGPVYEGEKRKFRFTAAKVGEVGYRYGASRDDRRHGRKSVFDKAGKRKYAFP